MKLDKEQKPGELYVFVQISKGSKNFYKKDEETGIMTMVKTVEEPFPGNYGIIPNTHHNDAEALDSVILTEEPIGPGTIIKVKPIGVIRLKGQINDDIIISVPFGSPANDISDLSMKHLNDITAYFERFKKLKTLKVFDSEYARRIAEHAITRFKREK